MSLPIMSYEPSSNHSPHSSWIDERGRVDLHLLSLSFILGLLPMVMVGHGTDIISRCRPRIASILSPAATLKMYLFVRNIILRQHSAIVLNHKLVEHVIEHAIECLDDNNSIDNSVIPSRLQLVLLFVASTPDIFTVRLMQDQRLNILTRCDNLPHPCWTTLKTPTQGRVGQQVSSAIAPPSREHHWWWNGDIKLVWSGKDIARRWTAQRWLKGSLEKTKDKTVAAPTSQTQLAWTLW